MASPSSVPIDVHSGQARPHASFAASLALKRILDVLIAATLLVLLLPVLLVLAIAIKLDSPGPVFFRQRRRGRSFEPFQMWKFRSMKHNAPDPAARYETVATDARITRVGHFIRRTSLDELPQLFNVMGGTMSLVGPRPLVDWESEEAVKTHQDRFLLPPGITGLSQVEVRNGAPFAQRLDKDVEYVRRHSLWLDLSILLRTPARVVQADMIYPEAK